MLQLNYPQVKGTNEVFKRLNRLRRWTDIVSKGTYNELNKQALNCIIAYFLACFVEAKGSTVMWERFPKFALYRAFQKIYVVFNTPAYKYDEIFNIGDIKSLEFSQITWQKIAEHTDEDFANFLCEPLNSDEERIYKAATKIATFIELQELANYCSPEVYQRKLLNMLGELSEFEDIPGFLSLTDTDSKLFKLLAFLSNSDLRHHIRWCEVGYTQECSILGHLFDTACFAYLMSLEEAPNNEKLATTRFFMGVFHDVPEAWTTDIPSPIKDSIKGFRTACEKYEQYTLEENLYAFLPDSMKIKIKEVIFEDPNNVAQHKALIKGADYLSADSECWRQYVLGSRDPYFKGAMERRIPGIENGEVALTPACKKLFNYFRNYAEKLHLEDLEEDFE